MNGVVYMVEYYQTEVCILLLGTLLSRAGRQQDGSTPPYHANGGSCYKGTYIPVRKNFIILKS